jgi:hypothetical protein
LKELNSRHFCPPKRKPFLKFIPRELSHYLNDQLMLWNLYQCGQEQLNARELILSFPFLNHGCPITFQPSPKKMEMANTNGGTIVLLKDHLNELKRYLW